jgi:hypothetical protein
MRCLLRGFDLRWGRFDCEYRGDFADLRQRSTMQPHQAAGHEKQTPGEAIPQNLNENLHNLDKLAGLRYLARIVWCEIP